MSSQPNFNFNLSASNARVIRALLAFGFDQKAPTFRQLQKAAGRPANRRDLPGGLLRATLRMLESSDAIETEEIPTQSGARRVYNLNPDFMLWACRHIRDLLGIDKNARLETPEWREAAGLPVLPAPIAGILSGAIFRDPEQYQTESLAYLQNASDFDARTLNTTVRQMFGSDVYILAVRLGVIVPPAPQPPKAPPSAPEPAPLVAAPPSAPEPAPLVAAAGGAKQWPFQARDVLRALRKFRSPKSEAEVLAKIGEAAESYSGVDFALGFKLLETAGFASRSDDGIEATAAGRAIPAADLR